MARILQNPWTRSRGTINRVGLWAAAKKYLILGVVALGVLLPPTAEALRFLGCDWGLEGTCLVGYCNWFGKTFIIYICLVM